MPDVEESMMIVLSTQIETTAAQTTLTLRQLIQTMRASGATDDAIREILLTDLETGGRIFGEFRNKIKAGVKNGVQYANRAGSREVYDEAGVKEFEWVAIADDRICDDCAERDGRKETWEFWETIGLPQSGFSVCTDNCRCELVAVK